MQKPPTAVFAASAWLPDGWATDVRIAIDGRGTIAAVEAGSRRAAGDESAGIVIPGMPNVHCHAFQRAMAGLTQRAGPEGDDFWSWRETMYRFLARLDPDRIEAIAAQLYVEMLAAGYTSVAEFHYVHNDPAGRPYADRAEIARRLIAAARRTGIRLTLLPVLYQTGNFGGAPPTAGQRRFLMSTDDFNAMVESLGEEDGYRLGIAPHSLRAVPPAAMREAIAAIHARDPQAPVHIHVAEQRREVEDCLAWCGRRPVQWLLDEMAPDHSWTLVHCTHMDAAETAGLARSGAVAGLCPTTEADLGDGVFPLLDYVRQGGCFAIGSDSNVGTAPAEELRWLEYAQRLQAQRRNLVPAPPQSPARGTEQPGQRYSRSIGARLWRTALEGGARSLAQPVGVLAPGNGADLLALDPDHPALAGRAGDDVLDSLVFAGAAAAIRHVMVGGRWVIRDGRHVEADAIASDWRAAMRSLA